MKKDKTRLSITITKEEHKELKEYCKKNEMFMKDYLIYLHRINKKQQAKKERTSVR